MTSRYSSGCSISTFGIGRPQGSEPIKSFMALSSVFNLQPQFSKQTYRRRLYFCGLSISLSRRIVFALSIPVRWTRAACTLYSFGTRQSIKQTILGISIVQQTSTNTSFYLQKRSQPIEQRSGSLMVSENINIRWSLFGLRL